MGPRTYRVSACDQAPLLDFIVSSLQRTGCRIIYGSSTAVAPLRVTFETSAGERLGIVAYASVVDHQRFQFRFGLNDSRIHQLWQDPSGLYTTLFLGINPDEGFFVGADPVLHNLTNVFVSIEFKQSYATAILRAGWHVWERDRRVEDEEPVEVLVGGMSESFLTYVHFERDVLGDDQGHRHLLAENTAQVLLLPCLLQPLARRFDLSDKDVADRRANLPGSWHPVVSRRR